MEPQGPVQPMAEIQLPAAFAARVRRGSTIVGVTVIAGALLIYLVVRWLAPIIASGAPSYAITAFCGLPALFGVAIGVAVIVGRSCLSGDRLVIERARRMRAAYVVLLAGLLAVTVLGMVMLVYLADPGVDGVVLAFMLIFSLLVGVLGYASGRSFIRPTTGTLQRYGDTSAW